MTERDQTVRASPPDARHRVPWLLGLGAAQLLLWVVVVGWSERFTPGSGFGQRPLLPVVGLLAANFVLYLGSLTLVWRQPEVRQALRVQLWAIVVFAVLFRLPLWWSQPIEEIDIYRYLWDGRVLAAGVNPYRYSPAQVKTASEQEPATPELEQLARLLRRSPEVSTIFSRIDHRSVPTIYPPLSEGLFAVAALVTPERASVPAQVRVLKAILLLFDLATIALVIGLFRNLGQPPGRALAYAWCPLALKEFANTGHLDSIAVCFTAAVLWLLTRPCGADYKSALRRPGLARPSADDWLASVLWAGAVLAKLYPLVLAPVLLVHWWRKLRWRTGQLVLVAALILVGGYAVLPPVSRTAGSETPVDAGHSSFSGLGEFLQRWEMNDLLFSIVYENVKPRDHESGHHEPWYSILPDATRTRLNALLDSATNSLGLRPSTTRLAFLFTQTLAGGTLLALACCLALRRWPEDPREELLRRVFLCLAWLWFLNATQNPWYWTWALPFVVFASRPWLMVSGLALIYYLRFWFIHTFPQPTLPGGLTGQRFFNEVVVWIEHLPVMLAVAYFSLRNAHRCPMAMSTDESNRMNLSSSVAHRQT